MTMLQKHVLLHYKARHADETTWETCEEKYQRAKAVKTRERYLLLITPLFTPMLLFSSFYFFISFVLPAVPWRAPRFLAPKIPALAGWKRLWQHERRHPSATAAIRRGPRLSSCCCPWESLACNHRRSAGCQEPPCHCSPACSRAWPWPWLQLLALLPLPCSSNQAKDGMAKVFVCVCVRRVRDFIILLEW
jgi:hypothetical protein